MPTQAELDKEQKRTKSRSGTIGKIDLGGGVYDLNTRPDDNKEGTDERIQNDGIDKITSPLKDDSGGGGGGSGLPDGTTENDTIYWDGEDWVILAAPSETGTWLIGVVEGTIQWVGTDNC